MKLKHSFPRTLVTLVILIVSVVLSVVKNLA
jgi:hypothetical protein